ncbi:MAG TPA: ATP-binding cassette domain-containing protein [Gemmatimonadales bacterium]|nr:ATP-binding cassette domain-containing protein [Gemmatimonadales bacterium]
MSHAAVRVDHVTKRFAGHTAVHDLTLEVPTGGIFGLLGPNGAGKSTTIRMMMNIITPDEGKVLLFGTTATGRDLAHRVGYLPEERGLYKKMKVLDHLIFLGEIRNLSRPEARRRATAWLERLGLTDWTVHKIEDLSKGMQQKVQFIGALIHDPELVILDEPFSGLDPVNSKVMKDVVVEIARSGRSVLFSTHQMEQAEKMCDRVAIIARGEKVLDGSLSEIKAAGGKRNVALSFYRDAAQAARVLEDRRLVSRVEDHGTTAEAELAAASGPDELLKALVASGAGLSRFEVVEPSLEAIFIDKVGIEAARPVAREDANA